MKLFRKKEKQHTRLFRKMAEIKEIAHERRGVSEWDVEAMLRDKLEPLGIPVDCRHEWQTMVEHGVGPVTYCTRCGWRVVRQHPVLTEPKE